MSPYYRRTTPGPRENLTAGLVAGGLAAGVGALAFYLVRIFLARESLGPVRGSVTAEGRGAEGPTSSPPSGGRSAPG